jgi:hypothetical protein
LVKEVDKLVFAHACSVLDRKVGEIDINNVEKLIGGTGNLYDSDVSFWRDSGMT